MKVRRLSGKRKPKRVVLIQPAIEDFYTTPIRMYPLGLLYAARVFMTLGCQVRILDCMTPFAKKQKQVPPEFAYLKPLFENNPFLFKGFYHFGMPEDHAARMVIDAEPDLVGISAQFTAYFKSVETLVHAIDARADIPIVLGGHHATVFADEIRRRLPNVAAILTGPAERAIPDWIENESESLDWKRMAPAHEMLKGDAYRIGKRNYVSLTASRGCPHACEFCSVDAMFGRKIDYRTIDDVIEEMVRNRRLKQVCIFNFEDDNLSFCRRWFSDFLQAIANERRLAGIELTAMNGLCHADLDRDLLHLMNVAGFKRINLSWVTRDDALQKQYRRPGGGKFEDLVKTAKRLGMFVTAYVIIGLPEQTYEEVKDSIDYLLNLGVLVGPSVFYLPPGSRLFDKLDVPRNVLENWDLYRSSAFALETPHLTRTQLVELFAYAREKNLANK